MQHVWQRQTLWQRWCRWEGCLCMHGWLLNVIRSKIMVQSALRKQMSCTRQKCKREGVRSIGMCTAVFAYRNSFSMQYMPVCFYAFVRHHVTHVWHPWCTHHTRRLSTTDRCNALAPAAVRFYADVEAELLVGFSIQFINVYSKTLGLKPRKPA